MRSPLPMILGVACSLSVACAPRPAPPQDSDAADPVVADAGQVAVEGGTLHYETSGSGPAVVLLHGGGLDLTMWDPQVETLSRSFHVIRYDSRGHGRSTAPMGPYSMVEDLRRVLDHLGVQQAHVVGLSMGGGVALDFASAYPERALTLTLVSTSGPPPGAPLPPGTPPPLTEEAGRARLGALTMPWTLIVGAEDSPNVLAAAGRVEAEVPQASVVRIPGGAHLINHDAPVEFNEALLRFLREE